jgi:hypothetical protein
MSVLNINPYFNIGLDLARQYQPQTSPVQASLDEVTRQGARLLFRADAILNRVHGDFESAEHQVQEHYLLTFQQAIALASQALFTDARGAAIAETEARVNKDEDLLEGDLFVARTAAEIATAELPRQLQKAYRLARGRR